MARDPYRYFRIEAQELLEGLGQGLLALEKGTDIELVRRLLRQAHTLKGASRVVKRSDIGDLAHQMEDLLEPHRESGGPVARDTIDRALELLDAIRSLVASLGQPAPAVEAAAPQAVVSAGHEPVIRVNVTSLDALLEAAEEASIRLSRVRRRLDELDPESLARSLDEVQTEVDELRAALAETRLVPLSTVIADVERIVRDAARVLDKQVVLHATGAEAQVDAHVLHRLRGALVHLVRNAVAHGIEDRATRARNGKPEVGRIELAVERRGHRVEVSCRDDGRGLALDAVRAAVAARGYATADAALEMEPNELGRLLLRGGVSTSETVTDVSGRGVGLDAVRKVVEELGGEITLESTPGEGTLVSIAVPVSLSAMPALAVAVDGATALLPLDTVRRTLRVLPGDVLRDGEGDRLVVDGRAVPFLRLERVMGRPPAAAIRTQSAVVIEAEGELAAMGVDRLHGARNVIVRAVPAHAGAPPSVAGAAFDDEGRPQLLLFAPALVRAASTARAIPETPAASIPPLLVVDDSLTTRMLEQTILESAGYEVDVAVSAEDALEKARARSYGAFIVDVEMPGMSGFELLEEMKRDPELRDIPAILVTSRAHPDDKRRGKDVGARAYIVKSEFDQGELIGTIRRLVG